MGGSEFREVSGYDDDSREPRRQDAADLRRENAAYGTVGEVSIATAFGS